MLLLQVPCGVRISPADIIPLPSADQRRVWKKGRKKVDTTILTKTRFATV